MELFARAAHEGLVKAQAIVLRLHSALKISVSNLVQESLRDWLFAGATSGSRISLEDLARQYLEETVPEIRLDQPRMLKGKQRALENYSLSHQYTSPERQIDGFTRPDERTASLLLACRANDVEKAKVCIKNGADINRRGVYGESPLHCAVFCSIVAPSPLVMFLIEGKADLHHETHYEYPISQAQHFCNSMPIHTTPVEWAILKDDEVLVRFLLEMDSDLSHRPNLQDIYVLQQDTNA